MLIGQPRRYRGGHPDYYCPFKIEGFDGRIRYASGVDAVQALQLVMKAIGSELATSKRILRWNAGQQVGDLGFPGLETDGPASKQMQQAMAKVFSEAFGRSLKASQSKDTEGRGLESGVARRNASPCWELAAPSDTLRAGWHGQLRMVSPDLPRILSPDLRQLNVPTRSGTSWICPAAAMCPGLGPPSTPLGDLTGAERHIPSRLARGVAYGVPES